MIRSLKDNPILLYQIRNAKWPSLRIIVWMTAGLTVIGLALTIGGYAISPDGEKGWVLVIPGLIVLTETLLLVFGPLITAVVTVTATVRTVGSEAYRVMRLSILSDLNVIHGYLASALFRLRLVWMVAGGLVPPLVMAVTHIGVFITILSTCNLNHLVPPSHAFCNPLSPAEIVMEQAGTALIITMLYVILFIVLHWLAISLGLWMVFRHRHLGMALFWTLLPLLFVIGLNVAAIITMSSLVICSVIFVVGFGLLLALAAYHKALQHV